MTGIRRQGIERTTLAIPKWVSEAIDLYLEVNGGLKKNELVQQAILSFLPTEFVELAKNEALSRGERVSKDEALLDKGKVVKKKLTGSRAIVIARQSTWKKGTNKAKHEAFLKLGISQAKRHGFDDPDYIYVSNLSGTFGADLALKFIREGYKALFFEDFSRFSRNFDRGKYVLDKAFFSDVKIFIGGSNVVEANNYVGALIGLIFAEIELSQKITRLGKKRLRLLVQYLNGEVDMDALKQEEKRFLKSAQYVGLDNFVSRAVSKVEKLPDLRDALVEAYERYSERNKH